MAAICSITEYDKRQRRMALDRRAAPGRYTRSGDTRAPSDVLARTPVQQRESLVVGAVANPYDDGAPRIIDVAINRRVDLLETERSHKRISEAAYLAGRKIQVVLERFGKVTASSWASVPRVDKAVARDGYLVRSFESAATIRKLADEIQKRVGMVDTRLLRRILGERLSYAECATLEGKSGERGQRYVAARFRAALEDLAQAWAAKGSATPSINDKHARAAFAAISRQAASIRDAAQMRGDRGDARRQVRPGTNQHTGRRSLSSELWAILDQSGKT